MQKFMTNLENRHGRAKKKTTINNTQKEHRYSVNKS